jgi:molybdopterin synthase sulfur carrier subunit
MTMLKVNLFASLREVLGTGGLELELPEHVVTVEQLAAYLVQQQGADWAILQDATRVLVAVDHSVATKASSIAQAQEVAFFPPMTGG